MISKIEGRSLNALLNIRKYLLPVPQIPNNILSRGILTYKDIPKAPSFPLIGSLPHLLRSGGSTRFHNYIEKLHRKLGPIFRHRVLGVETVHLSDPESVLKVYLDENRFPETISPDSMVLFNNQYKKKRGLFFMQGIEWYENRSALGKLLLPVNNMSKYMAQISTISKEFIDIWKTDPPHNLEHHLYSWNLECIGEISLGTRLGFIEKLKDVNKYDMEYVYAKSAFDAFTNTGNFTGLNGKIAQALKLKSWTEFYSAAETSLECGKRYVQKEVGKCTENADERVKNSLLYSLYKESGFDTELVSAVLADLMIASADTTVHALKWSFHFLGRNPQVIQRARKEILSTLGNDEGTFENIQKLKYTKYITKETLRLIGLFLSRRLDKDLVMYGYFVPSRTTILSSLYSMGRDSKNFSDPLSFRPERWIRKDSDSSEYNFLPEIFNHNPKAYLPWSHGRRSCVGKRVAETTMTLLMIEAIRTFDWTTKEVELLNKMVAIPSKPIVVDFSESPN